MRPAEFDEAVPAGTRLTLFSSDGSDRLFAVITFLMNKVSGVALDLETDVPCYQVEDGLPRRRLGGGGRKAEFIYCFTTRSKKKMKARWCLWRPDQIDFDSRSIFEGALVEEYKKQWRAQPRSRAT